MSMPATRPVGDFDKAARVSPVICLHEGDTLDGREVADLEDRRDMPRRNRDRISRIGDLRDEAAVAFQGVGQALARPRRPAVQHIAQNALVGGDKVDLVIRGRSRLNHGHLPA